MKFYDKGFIFYYDDYVNLQLLNIGNVVLDMSIYPDKICKSSFECLDANSFNERFLHKSYKKSFLYDLFQQNTIYFKDKKNKILIKVK